MKLCISLEKRHLENEIILRMEQSNQAISVLKENVTEIAKIFGYNPSQKELDAFEKNESDIITRDVGIHRNSSYSIKIYYVDLEIIEVKVNRLFICFLTGLLEEHPGSLKITR